MSEKRTRKTVYQDYYTEEDYESVLSQLPDIIKEIDIKAGELLEPSIVEKKSIRKEIFKFIKEKNRKTYGGTAVNETIKLINPKDAIYDEHKFGDIEFYSPTPVPDMVELTNILHEKKHKYIVSQEAQHEETYKIFVNFQEYCDITYVAQHVYNGIPTITIDGIQYVHPHFILIDQLRIINQPLTAASLLWEKTFNRMYKVLKNYPFEYFDKFLIIKKPSEEIEKYIKLIKDGFLTTKEIQESCLIAGFEAYNFYVMSAIHDKQSRTSYGSKDLKKYLAKVPYLELISVTYKDTVERTYNFIKNFVPEPKKISLDEYFPLFQFTKYSVSINYDGKPIIKIFEADGFCIPNIRTHQNRIYVTYQYLLMMMLINKFWSHLNRNKDMYFNYNIAISNLVNIRNTFLINNDLGVINDTVFGDFKMSCTGTTKSYIREGKIRNLGKKIFRYTPEKFFASSKEAQKNFDPKAHQFKNTSGNKILNPKNLLFRIDENGNIGVNVKAATAETEENMEKMEAKIEKMVEKMVEKTEEKDEISKLDS